jgi:methyl-accepting chemotaxis protein
LENTNWSIRVTENYSSQKESIQSFRIYYLLVFILLVIGAILIQSFFAQQITFPIQKAIQVFEQIKRTQDYSIRLEINQKDEFSKFAISINE